MTDDFGTILAWRGGSYSFDRFEQTVDFQTFDFFEVSSEYLETVTKFTLTVGVGGNVVGPFVFEDVRLAPEDAMPKPPVGPGEVASN